MTEAWIVNDVKVLGIIAKRRTSAPGQVTVQCKRGDRFEGSKTATHRTTVSR